MSNTIYTATGCTRCKIVKDFMKKQGVDYVEKNIKEDGNKDFREFYRKNRKSIFRGSMGVEFPVFTDGEKIRQGIGAAIAYIYAGEKLDKFFSVGTLHKEWVDGIHVSTGKPEYAEDFLEVLRYLKKNNMKLQIDTNGLNSNILKQIFDEKLADKVIMNVVGPENLYSDILGKDIDFNEIKNTIELVPKFPEYQFQTTIVPVLRQENEITYMTKNELSETAKMIKEITGSMKNPYLIKFFNPKEAEDERLKSMAALPQEKLLSYRTAARSYQVFTEVEKNNN